ncbi:hypothetical protein AURDEDRAFT_149884 [Auricularia subglabra TFB-10046 SS5]|nr:hypothetical protein AURDEDRAFT_149884 [Auricularia subglabra TFB-10046 SS5]
MATMDVDEINDDYLLEWFDLSEDAFPWREELAASIHARRSLMGGELFIDTLLPAAADSRLLGDSEDSMDEGSSAGPLYPPTDPAMFRRLLHALQRSPHSGTKRDSIALYFLCAWYPAAAADPNGFSTGADGEPYANALDDAKLRKFTQALLIQPHYASIVRAYYLLDHGQLEPAVALLSDARILPEWSSKILNTLSLPGLDVTAPLVLKYIRCSKPTLSAWDDMTIYLSALVKTSLMEAWLYQRSFPNGPLRQQFIRRILDLSLIPEHKSEPLKLLVAFPFDEAEETTIRSYAQEPPDALPPKSLAVLRQLLLVRLIQSGKYTEALKFDRAMPVPDRDEARIKERQALMQHVLSLIPPAQREEVEREYAQQVQAQAHAQTNGITSQPASPAVPPVRAPSISGSWAHIGREQDLSMSMSWEDLGRAVPSPVPGFSNARRTSLSRLEGPAVPSIGTPTKRGTDSPARARAYGNAAGSSQPSSASPFRTSMAKPFPRPTYQPAPNPRSSGTVTPSKRSLPDSPLIPVPTVLGMQGLGDIEMVESDDPDAFVVRPSRPGVTLPPARRAKDRAKKAAEPVPVQREPELPPPVSRPTLPGAFPGEEHAHEQDEPEPAEERRQHRSKRQRQGESFELEPVVQQQQPAKSQTKASTRVRKSHTAAAPPPPPPATRKTRARRPSMPGEMPDLADSDGTEESEQEDTLPALPRAKTRRSVAAPAAGGGRRSRASSSEPEAAGPVRRSTRLSTASSFAEEPAKAKKSTSGRRRTSVEPAAAAAGTSRMATRRSRMTLDGVEE